MNINAVLISIGKLRQGQRTVGRRRHYRTELLRHLLFLSVRNRLRAVERNRNKYFNNFTHMASLFTIYISPLPGDVNWFLFISYGHDHGNLTDVGEHFQICTYAGDMTV